MVENCRERPASAVPCRHGGRRRNARGARDPLHHLRAPAAPVAQARRHHRVGARGRPDRRPGRERVDDPRRDPARRVRRRRRRGRHVEDRGARPAGARDRRPARPAGAGPHRCRHRHRRARDERHRHRSRPGARHRLLQRAPRGAPAAAPVVDADRPAARDHEHDLPARVARGAAGEAQGRRARRQERRHGACGRRGGRRHVRHAGDAAADRPRRPRRAHLGRRPRPAAPAGHLHRCGEGRDAAGAAAAGRADPAALQRQARRHADAEAARAPAEGRARGWRRRAVDRLEGPQGTAQADGEEGRAGAAQRLLHHQRQERAHQARPRRPQGQRRPDGDEHRLGRHRRDAERRASA